MTELERQELENLKERTWHLDGHDGLNPNELDRFFELMIKEQEIA